MDGLKSREGTETQGGLTPKTRENQGKRKPREGLKSREGLNSKEGAETQGELTSKT